MKYEEPNQYALRIAKKELATASHLTYVTYGTIKDIKLLLPIVEHIAKAAKLALQALLEYELSYKRIDPYASGLQAQIDAFESQVFRRYEFEKEHLQLLKRLNKIINAAQEAVISFKRDNRFFLSNYEMETESIGIDDVKKYLRITKSFIGSVEKIIK